APPAHAHRMDDAGLTIVFRSRRRRECDERLLVLTAVGVEGFVAPAPDWSEFLLQVDVAQAELAVRHLAQYEAENRAPLPPPPPPSLYPHAWIGCAAYVLVLLGVAWVLSNGLVRLDAFDQGVLDAARVQGGEPRRGRLVRIPRGPSDGRRHGVAPHRDGCSAREPAGGPHGSARASGGRSLDGGVRGARSHVGSLLARAPAVAAALGAALGA